MQWQCFARRDRRRRVARRLSSAAVAPRASATQRLEAAYANLTPAEVSKRWWTDADTTIEDWVTDCISSSKEHLGLGDDVAKWPKPRDLQTPWAMHAYMMARIVMNIGFNRKIGDGDAHDAHHYASSCYADVFVTEDGALGDTVKLIPSSLVAVLSFDEFAAQFEITPR